MQSTSKYLNQISLHEKAILILEMITKYINQINSAENSLDNWDKSRWDDPLRLMNTRRQLEKKLESYQYYLARTKLRY